MNLRKSLPLFLCLGALSAGSVAFAQDNAAPAPDAPVHQQGQGRNREGQNGERPTFGKITAIHDSVIDLAKPDGQTVTVKVTPQTEFRKDREPAKAADFKVGDMVAVRGDENADHTITARTIGARSGGPGAGGPGGGATFFGGGTLGKDYVLGQVKAIDPPRLTVVRTDNVTQTLELNEDTTLRRGRDSITMADIQVGDHVVARGAAQNDVFVPKNVMVMSPEQWERMQQFIGQGGGPGIVAKPVNPDAPAAKP